MRGYFYFADRLFYFVKLKLVVVMECGLVRLFGISILLFPEKKHFWQIGNVGIGKGYGVAIYELEYLLHFIIT